MKRRKWRFLHMYMIIKYKFIFNNVYKREYSTRSHSRNETLASSGTVVVALNWLTLRKNCAHNYQKGKGRIIITYVVRKRTLIKILASRITR